jgi:hypothetical protein
VSGGRRPWSRSRPELKPTTLLARKEAWGQAGAFLQEVAWSQAGFPRSPEAGSRRVPAPSQPWAGSGCPFGSAQRGHWLPLDLQCTTAEARRTSPPLPKLRSQSPGVLGRPGLTRRLAGAGIRGARGTASATARPALHRRALALRARPRQACSSHLERGGWGGRVTRPCSPGKTERGIWGQDPDPGELSTEG